MTVDIRLLGPNDGSVLSRVAEDVFDNPVDPRLTAEFIADPRHHIAVAIDAGVVVGMATAVHYVHPDKQPELWINEVAVAPTHRREGVGKRMLQTLFARARELQCRAAWVATEPDNLPARRLYASTGGEECAEPFVMFNFPLDDAAEG